MVVFEKYWKFCFKLKQDSYLCLAIVNNNCICSQKIPVLSLLPGPRLGEVTAKRTPNVASFRSGPRTRKWPRFRPPGRGGQQWIYSAKIGKSVRFRPPESRRLSNIKGNLKSLWHSNQTFSASWQQPSCCRAVPLIRRCPKSTNPQHSINRPQKFRSTMPGSCPRICWPLPSVLPILRPVFLLTWRYKVQYPKIPPA